MAVSTIMAPSVGNAILALLAGQTLTISFSGGAGIWGLLVTVYGPQNNTNDQSSLYIVNRYTANINKITPVLASQTITTSVSGDNFAFANTGTYGVRVSIITLGAEGGTMSVSVN